MSGRLWTDEDDLTMRQHYGRTDNVALARLLNRTVFAVVIRAGLLGLAQKRTTDAVVRARISALSQAGHSDQEIADEMRMTRENVRYHRQRMGLSGNRRHPRQQQRARENGRRGAANLLPWQAQTKSDADTFARESGWPLGLRLRQVQMLNLLAATGRPMTRRQLCEGVGLGRQPDSGQHRLISVDRRPGYVRELCEMGLLTRLAAMGPRASPAGGKGRRQDLFVLGVVAIQLLAERAKAASPGKDGAP